MLHCWNTCEMQPQLRNERKKNVATQPALNTFQVAPNCLLCFWSQTNSASCNSFYLGCAPRCKFSQDGVSNPTSKKRSLHCFPMATLWILFANRCHHLSPENASTAPCGNNLLNLPNEVQCSIVVLRRHTSDWEKPHNVSGTWCPKISLINSAWWNRAQQRKIN